MCGVLKNGDTVVTIFADDATRHKSKFANPKYLDKTGLLPNYLKPKLKEEHPEVTTALPKRTGKVCNAVFLLQRMESNAAPTHLRDFVEHPLGTEAQKTALQDVMDISCHDVLRNSRNLASAYFENNNDDNGKIINNEIINNEIIIHK
eukprot:Trichotokara_eunicae@DN7960_c0_g1_i1.p1